jgi:membrane protein YqaA with SNARE-associated domain
MNWFRGLRDWSLDWAKTKWGPWALFLCAFADATFLPLPTPLFFLTLTLLNISKAYRYAIYATAGIFAGAIVGYAVGHFAWLNENGGYTRFAQFMFDNIPGISEAAYNTIRIQYEKWDFWILFIASFMPLPFNIFTVSSGVFDVNVLMFSFSTLISQGIRFFLMAFLTVKLGPEVKKLFGHKWTALAIISTVCIGIVIALSKTL